MGSFLMPENKPKWSEDEHGKWGMVIDQDLCIKCGACFEVCPPKVTAVSKYTGKKKDRILKKTPRRRVKK